MKKWDILMTVKTSENIITSLLSRELRKHGIKATPFAKIITPQGRREVDIYCQNSGNHIIETKFTEKELLDAISMISNDYLKFHEELSLHGCFAVLYPEKFAKLDLTQVDHLEQVINNHRFTVVLLFPPRDTRKNITKTTGDFRTITQTIAKHIKTPPVSIEPDIEFIIEVLRESSYLLTQRMENMTSDDITMVFGDENVFENILQHRKDKDKEKKFPLTRLMPVAGYILTTQLLFHHVISRLTPEISPIDPTKLKSIKHLNEYFDEILKNINYRAIFHYRVTKLLPEIPQTLKTLKQVINVIQALSPEKVRGDLLGTIFHDLIPLDVRKFVAAYYTNVNAADLLAHLVISHPDQTVADLACGSGGLLVAAYNRKKHLLRKRGKQFTQQIHERFLKRDLLGVDVMPSAASIAASNIALQDPHFFTNQVNIAIWDSTDLEPGKKIPLSTSLSRRLTDVQVTKSGHHGQSSLTMKTMKKRTEFKEPAGVAECISLSKVDVILMNPPFTRQERFPQEYKSLLVSERFREYTQYFSGQLSYHGYFFFLADKFIKPGGMIGFVVPSTVLKAKSFAGIRKLLSEHYHVHYIIATSVRSAFSENTKFREIIIVFQKIALQRKQLPRDDNTAFVSLDDVTNGCNDANVHCSQANTKIVFLKRLPKTRGEIEKLCNDLLSTKENIMNDSLWMRIYDWKQLKEDPSDWFHYISMQDPRLLSIHDDLLRNDPSLVRIPEVILTKRSDLSHYKFKNFHGFILRHAKRMQKRTDFLIVNKELPDSIEIKGVKLISPLKFTVKKQVLGRGLRRLSNLTKMDVSRHLDYLILRPFDELKEVAMTILKNKTDVRTLLNDHLVKWLRKYEQNKCNLAIARRLDLGASGTSHLAFYSENDFVPTDHFWAAKLVENSLRNWQPTDTVSSLHSLMKLITLWFNSVFGILQYLILRMESRGTWMVFHQHSHHNFFVPNITKLKKEDVVLLVEFFDQHAHEDWPSIVDQLQGNFPLRIKLDSLWMQALPEIERKMKDILGFPPSAAKVTRDDLLNHLYSLILDEMQSLKEMMRENSS